MIPNITPPTGPTKTQIAKGLAAAIVVAPIALNVAYAAVTGDWSHFDAQAAIKAIASLFSP